MDRLTGELKVKDTLLERAEVRARETEKTQESTPPPRFNENDDDVYMADNEETTMRKWKGKARQMEDKDEEMERSSDKGEVENEDEEIDNENESSGKMSDIDCNDDFDDGDDAFGDDAFEVKAVRPS